MVGFGVNYLRSRSISSISDIAKRVFLMAIIILAVLISGCIEPDVQPVNQTVNDTTDAPGNITSSAQNTSDKADTRSVSIPLKKPPFID